MRLYRALLNTVQYNYGAHLVSRETKEKKIFTQIASDWWNTSGKFKTLHQFNGVRVPYILSNLKAHFAGEENNNLPKLTHPANGPITVLDIGCGGGLITEPLAKAGYAITGIDSNEASITAAKAHAKQGESNITYLHECSLKNYNPSSAFDVILLMEVLEHVENLPQFIKDLKPLINPNGIIFFSTINRNLKSLITAKFIAEYVLNWLPRGIHSFKSFIKPSELAHCLGNIGFTIKDLKGVKYKLGPQEWLLSEDPSVNYLGYATSC